MCFVVGCAVVLYNIRAAFAVATPHIKRQKNQSLSAGTGRQFLTADKVASSGLINLDFKVGT